MAVKIKPEETALLVIDMKNDVLDEKGKLSKLGVWKFAKESKMIEKTKKVINFARKIHIPVIYVMMVIRQDHAEILEGSDFGRRIKADNFPFEKGTWGAEMVEELKPTPEDYIVEKKRFSAFYNTELETLLRSMDKRTLLICGVVTNMCIEATVWSAVDRDFNVIILSDCTASHSKEAQEFPMREVFPFIATVATSDELKIDSN
jgi:ureidoacrylate peracid hydrolase